MTDAIRYMVYLLLVLAALQDMIQLRISNLFFLALVALYPLWVFTVGFETDIWQNVVVFLLAFGLGALAFRGGMLGGGDVKLFMAAALWFDLGTAPRYLMSIAIFGAILTLVLIVLRRILPVAAAARTGGWAMLQRRGPIPYGVAITGGALLCASLYGFNPAPRLVLPSLDFEQMAAAR
jgi:prepilin peptidase CpaA